MNSLSMRKKGKKVESYRHVGLSLVVNRGLAGGVNQSTLRTNDLAQPNVGPEIVKNRGRVLPPRFDFGDGGMMVRQSFVVQHHVRKPTAILSGCMKMFLVYGATPKGVATSREELVVRKEIEDFLCLFGVLILIGV